MLLVIKKKRYRFLITFPPSHDDEPVYNTRTLRPKMKAKLDGQHISQNKAGI